MEPVKTQYFTLNDGVLELHEDKIVIFDKAKKNSILQRIGAVCWTIYAIATVLRAYKKDDYDFPFYLGIFLLLTWPLVLIKKIIARETTAGEIYLNDISSATFKNSTNREAKVCKIKTKQNRLRQILLSKVDLQDIKFQDELRKIHIVTTEK